MEDQGLCDAGCCWLVAGRLVVDVLAQQAARIMRSGNDLFSHRPETPWRIALQVWQE
jgi:hypothetical protein